MKLENEERSLLVKSVLQGENISDVATTLNCPRSTASRIFEVVVTRIWRYTNSTKKYSIEEARADKEHIIKNLPDYHSGALMRYKGDIGLDSDIYVLNIKSNIANPLVSAGISTIEDLISYSETELSSFDGIGKGKISKIKESLREQGFSLRK